MRLHLSLVASLTSLIAPLAAQDGGRSERPDSRFHVGLGVASGNFRFQTDGSNLDDRTDAILYRLTFEGTSRRGFGGGVRFEGVGTDDDLFEGTGFARSEANHGTVFAHFTYRLAEHRFAMPFRVG